MQSREGVENPFSMSLFETDSVVNDGDSGPLIFVRSGGNVNFRRPVGGPVLDSIADQV